MSSRLEIPLHLYEVLEEEYLSLHGPIPASEVLTIKLPSEEAEDRWREVRASRNWLFDEGHIKDPVSFVINLSSSSELQAQTFSSSTGVQPSDWMKENLKEYLRGKISKQPLKDILDWQPGEGASPVLPRELVRPLEDALNELLLDKNLYDPDRFSDNWLSETSQGFVHLRSLYEDSQDELCLFNRLLLEDAFPESLEKISNIRLAAMYQRFYNVEQKALCLSGGGIRSGIFALGVLQGLARHDLLKHFDYLSTVSSGGYIGSWLTAWIHRHPAGLEGVTAELASNNPASKIDPEPQPIRYLRTHSNLITPRHSLLTTDTWAFVSNYFMNLFLNWLVFIPLLIAVMTIPRLMLAITQMQPEDPQPLIIFLGWPFYSRDIFLILGFVLGVWALAYIIFNRPGLREQLRRRSRFWSYRPDQKSFLRWCLPPFLGSSFFLTTYWAWSREFHEEARTHILAFLLFGTSFTFLAWLIASIVIRRRWREIKLIEMAAILVAGIVGGLFFWVLEQPAFTSPVIGYNQPFDWTTIQLGAWKTEWYVCFTVPVFLLIFWLGATIFVGVLSASPRIDDEVREWWVRLGAWLLIAIIGWSVFNTLVLFSPIALLNAPRLVVSIGGLSGLLAILIGRSSKTSAADKPASEKSSAKDNVVEALTVRLLPLLAFAFLVPFIAAISLATTEMIRGLASLALWLKANAVLNSSFLEWLTNAYSFDVYLQYIYPSPARPVTAAEYAQIVHMNVLHHTSIWFILDLGLFMFAFSAGLAFFININIYSLRAIYRNRVIKVFLAASRPEGERRPNPFTGYDPADNIHMHALRQGLLNESDLIRPEMLATSLQAALNRAQADALSMYLVQNGLLKNSINELELYSPGDPVSPRLLASLIEDLNNVLDAQSLYAYDFSQPLLQTKRALRILETIKAELDISSLSRDYLREDYHLLLNRLVLEQAYSNTMKTRRLQPFSHKMMHVINAALNWAGEDKQRKADPFSITPLHSGSFRLGYRRSMDYGGRETGGISLGTAAAISGAAASSNIDFYTPPANHSLLLTLVNVLTLFNARLGWWLGNPGTAGDHTYYLRAPRYSFAPLIYEAFGLTDNRNKYVYLTDGGHFENLAIYEMVLRRCHIIIVSDGALDKEYSFGDLGNAVRKIRIDLGVPIEFTSVPIYSASPSKEKEKGMYWAMGKIRYRAIDGPDAKDGVLLYIKPAVYGDEPRDILQYKKIYPAFPHQSIGDQFFDEPQFESYRALGSHIIDQLCGGGTNELDLYQVIEMAFMQLTEETDDLKAAGPQLSG